MAKNFEFKLNLAGLNELMKSPECQDLVFNAGRAVAQNAGEGYDNEVHLASWVAISNVYPTTYRAMRKNYKENTLLKAVSASGLSTKKKGR